MEEAQFSEELFSTQDEATFQNADSLPDVVPEKSMEEDLIPVTSENTSSSAAQAARASVEKDTPDLVFSEDIDFDKHCEEAIDASDKSGAVDAVEAVESNENAENIAQPETSDEATESNAPQPKGENVSSSNAPAERLALFPFARIKQIMKLDPDVGIVSAEAIFVVTKAAELFLQTLAKDTSSHTLASKKKTMSKKDVESAIDNVDALMFLEGMMNV
ncbi:DNA polymerase epsilon subunit 4 isoform X1 [Anopheles moucheti]|uniref:DNA polymerase epsilon subunit 4 isoform X1 n=1 Tax=Anopheles moucheti TaxID=186751 RepID=UPI0022F026A0|nr:DNA polymerase epsilon subunit 4 isoform X1 [Anopheles moucheti]